MVKKFHPLSLIRLSGYCCICQMACPIGKGNHFGKECFDSQQFAKCGIEKSHRSENKKPFQNERVFPKWKDFI